MKKANKIIIAAATIVLVVSALFFVLRLKSTQSVLVENFSLLDTVYLSVEDPDLGNMTIELNVDFPVNHADENVLSNLKSSIISKLFGDDFTDCPEDSLLKAYAAFLGKEYIDNNADFAKRITEGSLLSFDNAIILDASALYDDQHIFSYEISWFFDFGGAHPNSAHFFYNFDLEDGSIITEDEIFIEGYQAELTAIIKSKLLSDLNVDEDTDHMTTLEEFNYWPEDIKPNGNFYIHKEAITYVFNPYEIAPYYMGETEVILPYQLIAHLMKSGNPLGYLVVGKGDK
jgi:hypothetical protein